MIQQTLDRLLPVAAADEVWVITNALLHDTISQQLPTLDPNRILSEPSARNTAPACALAAFILERTSPETVLGIFPSDHVVKLGERFAEVIRAGIDLAAGGERIVVLGVPPTRPETGYGYIEQGSRVVLGDGTTDVRRVKRFTEKPNRVRAEEFLEAGNYAWNSGIFLWSARTLAGAIREHCPSMAAPLEQIARAYGSPEFTEIFAARYSECENISIDYAVLEPRSAKGELHSEIYCLPADFAWNDLGSWTALHEHLADSLDGGGVNVIDGEQTSCVQIDARGNYIFAPGKVVALVGVEDLVVVETDDALLITTRGRSQDVGKVVQELKASDRKNMV